MLINLLPGKRSCLVAVETSTNVSPRCTSYQAPGDVTTLKLTHSGSEWLKAAPLAHLGLISITDMSDVVCWGLLAGSICCKSAAKTKQGS